MDVHLTPNQEAFVREAMASGRLKSPEEAVSQALSLWEERERRRMEILAALDAAEADIEAGRFETYSDETLPDLVEEMKREARAAKQTPLSA